MKNTVSEMTFSWGKINIALDHTEEKNEWTWNLINKATQKEWTEPQWQHKALQLSNTHTADVQGNEGAAGKQLKK
jgi:hypothetical protein